MIKAALRRVLIGDERGVSELIPWLMSNVRRYSRGMSVADQEDVVSAVLETIVRRMRNGGFPCQEEGHLRGYLLRTLKNEAGGHAQKYCLPTREHVSVLHTLAGGAPDEAAGALLCEILRNVDWVGTWVGMTSAQRQALGRRIETHCGAKLTDLLRRDGRLLATDTIAKVNAALEADGTLQRRALRVVRAGATLAARAQVLDEDSARLTTRFLGLLSERGSGVTRASSSNSSS